jgi:hypothetical protein
VRTRRGTYRMAPKEDMLGLSKLLAHVEEHAPDLLAIVATAIYTGMRKGSCSGCLWGVVGAIAMGLVGWGASWWGVWRSPQPHLHHLHPVGTFSLPVVAAPWGHRVDPRSPRAWAGREREGGRRQASLKEIFASS